MKKTKLIIAVMIASFTLSGCMTPDFSSVTEGINKVTGKEDTASPSAVETASPSAADGIASTSAVADASETSITADVSETSITVSVSKDGFTWTPVFENLTDAGKGATGVSFTELTDASGAAVGMAVKGAKKTVPAKMFDGMLFNKIADDVNDYITGREIKDQTDYIYVDANGKELFTITVFSLKSITGAYPMPLVKLGDAVYAITPDAVRTVTLQDLTFGLSAKAVAGKDEGGNPVDITELKTAKFTPGDYSGVPSKSAITFLDTNGRTLFKITEYSGNTFGINGYRFVKGSLSGGAVTKDVGIPTITTESAVTEPEPVTAAAVTGDAVFADAKVTPITTKGYTLSDITGGKSEKAASAQKNGEEYMTSPKGLVNRYRYCHFIPVSGKWTSDAFGADSIYTSYVYYDKEGNSLFTIREYDTVRGKADPWHSGRTYIKCGKKYYYILPKEYEPLTMNRLTGGMSGRAADVTRNGESVNLREFTMAWYKLIGYPVNVTEDLPMVFTDKSGNELFTIYDCGNDTYLMNGQLFKRMAVNYKEKVTPVSVSLLSVIHDFSGQAKTSGKGSFDITDLMGADIVRIQKPVGIELAGVKTLTLGKETLVKVRDYGTAGGVNRIISIDNVFYELRKAN